MKKLEKYFDHTNLKPDATERDMVKLCREAREWGFYSVCVNPCYLPLAGKQLETAPVRLCTVCGFPLGASSTGSKAREAADAVAGGAHEVDMVLNIGWVKDRHMERVRDEIETVVRACSPETIVKVILETCLLTDEEIRLVCQAALEGRADFVKTSTGFSSGGATVRDVAIMKKAVGSSMKIKASGGIKSLNDTLELIRAGADRLGASSSTHIMEEHQSTTEK